MYLTLKEQIEAKEKKIAQTKAQLMNLQAKEAKSKRNTETRRKTVIGGLILNEYQSFPKLNEIVKIGKYEFKIMKNTMTKIELVQLNITTE